MKQFAIIYSLLLTISSVLSGQTDPAAEKVMDSFSSKAVSAPSVSMKFKLVTIDQLENTSSTSDGKIVLKKDMYKLELPDNITWYNGIYAWSYLTNENEVTITKPQPEDDTFLSKPSSVFTLYQNGFKTRLISETGNQAVVDLYPEDIKNDLVRLRLTISKPSFELMIAEYKTRNGLTITLNVTGYDLKTNYEQSFFNFNTSLFKDVEIVDLR